MSLYSISQVRSVMKCDAPSRRDFEGEMSFIRGMMSSSRIQSYNADDHSIQKSLGGSITSETSSAARKKIAEQGLNNTKLGSASERKADLLQDDVEKFWRKRGKEPLVKIKIVDKANLRNWFAILDTDGSGEVSIDELEDPMISAGIVRTYNEVRDCFKEWDEDRSETISFDEFVTALSGKYRDKLKLLEKFSGDPSGFKMDTLLTAERRRNILSLIIDESIQRESEFNEVASKLSTSHPFAVLLALKRIQELESEHELKKTQCGLYLSALMSVLDNKIKANAIADKEEKASAEADEHSHSYFPMPQLQNLNDTSVGSASNAFDGKKSAITSLPSIFEHAGASPGMNDKVILARSKKKSKQLKAQLQPPGPRSYAEYKPLNPRRVRPTPFNPP